MKLRPHHLLDIISAYGRGVKFAPHPYGHALHSVAAQVLNDRTVEIEFVLAADDICRPCRHLQLGSTCDDVLAQTDEPMSKQAYNDALDSRLFFYLGIEPGTRFTVHEFLEKLNPHIPGIERICTHPSEQQADRLQGLTQGLLKLGIEPVS